WLPIEKKGFVLHRAILPLLCGRAGHDQVPEPGRDERQSSLPQTRRAPQVREKLDENLGSMRQVLTSGFSLVSSIQSTNASRVTRETNVKERQLDQPTVTKTEP